MNFKLEICADSVESAITARNAGANRIELCDSLLEGGITPSAGKIASARNNLDILLHVIIRPRGSDFLYSGIDYDIMRRDIEACGEAGVDGVVFGILLPDGNVDVDRTARLAELANPMSVTFHRAFDLCPDPLRGMEDIISAKADRILTSGQKNKAHEGITLIAELVKRAGKRINIMPGSGISVTNIAELARATGATEFHLSGRKTIKSEMEYRKTGICMGSTESEDEYTRKVADRDTIIQISEILKRI